MFGTLCLRILRLCDRATPNGSGIKLIVCSQKNKRFVLFIFHLQTISGGWYSVTTCTWASAAQGALDLDKHQQRQIENEIKNLLSSLSLCVPPPSTELVLSWKQEEQQVVPVCSGITECDFFLTSQAAIWHRGVIVSGGWWPFCHGRVEKHKAVPLLLCLPELYGLVSPLGEGCRLAHEWWVHMQGMAPLAFKLLGGKILYLVPKMPPN